MGMCSFASLALGMGGKPGRLWRGQMNHADCGEGVEDAQLLSNRGCAAPADPDCPSPPGAESAQHRGGNAGGKTSHNTNT